MNRKLLDPFKTNALPEKIEEFIEYGVAKTCAFNRRGTLLATGTDDGYVIIWDFETRSMAKILPAHSKQNSSEAPGKGQLSTVTSLSWSRNGRYLASGSLDKRVILWDVTKRDEAAQVVAVALPSGVNHVCLTPRKPYKAVVSLLQTAPVLVDLESKQVTPLASIDFKEGKGQLDVIINSTATGFAQLSKSGKEVYLGQLRGVITVYDTDSQKVLDVYRLQLPVAVKVVNMQLNHKGNILLVNCSDRVIRKFEVRPRPQDAKMYSIQELKDALAGVKASRMGSLLQDHPDAGILHLVLEPSYFNAVDRESSWKNMVISHDDEHVAAIVQSRSAHRIYFWDQHWGRMIRTLEAPKSDNAQDLAWHPTRSCLITLTSSGKVYIWSHIWDENWSSFAPDFYELDENVEYVEEEDEFDLNPKASTAKTGDTDSLEDEGVDILTREKLYAFSSDEEDERLTGDEAPLYYLPAEVNLIQATAPDEQQQPGAAEEGQDESSDEESEDDDKQEPEILDGPRKRKVRFDFTNAEDDADLDELLPPAGAKSAAIRGRGRGRRGRPPKTPAWQGPTGGVAYDAVGYIGQGFQNPGLPGRPVAYPGNILPGPEAQVALQQQQMFVMWGHMQQQQQQLQDQPQPR